MPVTKGGNTSDVIPPPGRGTKSLVYYNAGAAPDGEILLSKRRIRGEHVPASSAGRRFAYWDEGYTVVALANLDPPAAQRVAEYIRGRLK